LKDDYSGGLKMDKKKSGSKYHYLSKNMQA